MKKSPPNKAKVSRKKVKQIISLFNDRLGARKIAKEVGLTRPVVRRILSENGLHRPQGRISQPAPTERKCVECGEIKPIGQFYISSVNKNGTVNYYQYCKSCNTDICREKYRANRDKRVDASRKYRDNNKDKINSTYNKYSQNRKATDTIFRLRRNISSFVANYLKKSGGSKGGSFFGSIGYSKEILKQHIENQFEPWMTWENWGRYDYKTWKDNDPATWKWQIDHIKPQSDYPYDSMDHPNFKKVWALENLRP